MPAVSKKQQRFFGIVRAAQKGTLKGKKTLEVQRAAASMKKKDVKKMASTKHKGLPEKKVTKESFNEDAKMSKQSDEKLQAAHKKFSGMDKSPANTFMLKRIQREMNKRKKNVKYSMKEDYVKELEDGLVKMDYPTYDEVDKLMCKIAKDNDIDTTTLHMAFKTKHLMVPDDWAKKKMMEPVMIPKTPVNEISLPTSQVKKKDNPYSVDKKLKMIGTSIMDRVKQKAKSMTTVHKEDNDLERVRATQASAETVKLNQKSENKFKTGKKVSRETLKRMNKPENQFEGMKYGMYKGDGKPKGAMAAYLERKKKEKKEVKEEQNPEGMKYSDKKKLERQEQLKKASEKAPVVTNKIVPTSKLRTEGSLHKWFKGSKSKDGKGGWVNVVTGGTCASDEPGEGTPKCVSSSKRASMTKAERLSAARRKKKADPNQQSKTGAAKPTYVSTDKPKKKVNEDVEGRKTALTEPKTKTERLARKKDSEIRREAERSMYDTSAGESEIVKRQRIAKKLRSSTIPKNQEKGGQMEIDTTKKLVGEEFGKMTKEQEDIYVGNKAGRIKFDRITDYKKRQQLKKNLKTYPGDEDHTTTTAEAYSSKPSNLKKKAKLTAMLNRLQDLKVKKKLNEMGNYPMGKGPNYRETQNLPKKEVKKPEKPVVNLDAKGRQRYNPDNFQRQ